MKEIKTFNAGGYYLFESLSSSRSSYFESPDEIKLFKNLFSRYLGGYVDIYRMYFSGSGYQILLRVKEKGILIKLFRKVCRKKGKSYDLQKEKEVWRIVSERIRIFHSVYVKSVNSIRERSGVLVKQSYKRYYFESEGEFDRYIKDMEIGKEILSQKKKKYQLSKKWKKGVNWMKYRGAVWAERVVSRVFQHYVVADLINQTILSHSPPKNP